MKGVGGQGERSVNGILPEGNMKCEGRFLAKFDKILAKGRSNSTWENQGMRNLMRNGQRSKGQGPVEKKVHRNLTEVWSRRESVNSFLPL